MTKVSDLNMITDYLLSKSCCKLIYQLIKYTFDIKITYGSIFLINDHPSNFFACYYNNTTITYVRLHTLPRTINGVSVQRAVLTAAKSSQINKGKAT